ncbi:SDR family oxidoreductase [Streptomyces sp. NPDC002454]
MGNLTGKTALVTGSSRGIGRAIAQKLGSAGALVVVHYSTGADEAAEVVESIEKDGGRAFSIKAELGVPGDVDVLFEGLESGLKERAGTVNLNILVNNAGVMAMGAPEEVTPEVFDRMIAVNAKAPLFIVQRALPIIPDGGRIINITSGLTRVASPDQVTYGMTKGALEQIALHFSRHLGVRRITVNSVAPGSTDNGSALFQIPQVRETLSQLSTFGEVAEPAAVADVVAFLASEDARWITGAFIDASGGTLLG